MIHHSLLIRYSEIGLKKGNRSFFENKLKRNLLRSLGEEDNVQIRFGQKRLVLDGNETLVQKASEAFAKVPGVLSLRPAYRLEPSWDKIVDHFTEIIKQQPTKQQSFAVRAQRSDKRFPMDSQQLNQEIGGLVLQHRPQWHVNLDEPDCTVQVLITSEAIYISFTDVPGPGGLPVGSSGRLALLLSGGIDSPVAGYAMQRRGAELLGIYFHSFPYTGDQALNKVKDLRTVLETFQTKMPLAVVHFTQVQETIRDACDPKYSVVLNRRMMMRIAEAIACQSKALGLITGESLGQVASQTLENMQAVGSVTNLQVYRPLIAMDKTDIIRIATKIGSLEISNRPFEDCCTLFVAKHPVIRSRQDHILQEEAKIDIEALVETAFQNIEWI